MTGRNKTYRHANTCEVTGKRGYLDRKAARQNRRATLERTGEQTSEVRVYRCGHCQMFHIGHASPDPAFPALSARNPKEN